MRKTINISPKVVTFETDKSDKGSAFSKTTPNGPSNAPSGGQTPGGTVQIKHFIILENGFYLLQEDNGKFII
jgi:hypothetical protein